MVRLEAPADRILLGTIRLETDDGDLLREVAVEGPEVRIDEVPPGPYVVRAHVAGFARAVRAIRVPCDAVTLALVPIARVAGRVVGPNGAPAPARIRIVGSGIWPARVIEADPDGRFVIEDVPAGVYEVEAEHGSLMAEPRRGLTVDPEASVYLSFQLAEGAMVEGVVIDARSGRPVAGAEVTVAAAGLAASPRMVITGPDGRFVVRPFPAGLVSADVRAAGYVPAIAAGCRTGAPCRIALSEGATLRGRVLDIERRPIADAWVEVVGEARDRSPIAVTATTAPMAALLFSAPASSVPVAPPPSPLVGDLAAGLGVTAEVPPIPLASTGVGEVPLAASPAAAAPPSHTTLRTDAFGEFVVTGLPPGRVEVLARAPGFQVGRSARLSVAPGRARDDVELVLRPGASIHARVVDEHGRPADARVEVRLEGDPIPRYLATDARGELVIEDAGGVVLLAVAASGYPLLEEVVDVSRGDDVSRTLRLEAPTRALRARVVDPHGAPVSDALVRLETLRPGTGQPRTLVTDANGEITLSPAPHGSLLVTASHPAYVSAAPVVLTSSERGVAPVAELRLETPLVVASTVLDAWTGAPVAGARAMWTCLETVPCAREVESDDGGALVLRAARAGRYRVEVRAAGYATHVHEVVVRAPRRGTDLELDPMVLTPALTLEGDVVDVLGRVVEGAEVTTQDVGDMGDDRPVATSDDRGHFVLHGLAAGTHRLIVRHGAAGEVRMPLVVRRDRDPAPVVARLPGRADQDAPPDDRAARIVGVAIEVGDGPAGVEVRGLRSPSAVASGLLAGDLVREVDGVEVRDAASASARLRGASLVPALLRIERAGATLHVRIPRELHARSERF
jgi:hypothetical protein